MCVDWHYHSHVLALSLFCALFFCKAHVVVEWEYVLIYEYLPCLIHFLAFFFSYLTLAHHSVYIFMLTTSSCWWIFLNVFINKLLLATTTGKQCSTILLLTWKKMLPTWHFRYYWNNRAAAAGNYFLILVVFFINIAKTYLKFMHHVKYCIKMTVHNFLQFFVRVGRQLGQHV